MGKKGGWFSAVRKVLIPYDSKEKKDKKPQKTNSKKSWFGSQRSVDTSDVDFSQTESVFATPAPPSPRQEGEEEEEQLVEAEAETEEEEDEEEKPTKPENEQPPTPQQHHGKHSYSVAARAAEAAAAAAAVAAEVAGRFLGKSKEEIAAIKIQTAYRRCLARKRLRALRGMGRLKVLVQGQSVKRQATSALRVMQTLAHVQSQIRARRIRMSEENLALQRQLLQKHEKELGRARMGNEWDPSRKSKEQIEARLQTKQEAAARREKALAYAQARQQKWRNSSRSPNLTTIDPINLHWGWSWLERWMASRPWESQTPYEMELTESPLKTITRSASFGDLNRRPGCESPKTPLSRAAPLSGRFGPDSPRAKTDDDARRPRPRRQRRHSIASSSMLDEETSSLASPPRSPVSARARSRTASPSPSLLGSGKKAAAGPVKKRLSFSGPSSSDSPRRLSGPSKVGPGHH